MNASIKILQEESVKLEHLINIKTTQLKLPINILTIKEIREIKKVYMDFSSRLERLYITFNEAKEQKISQNRKIDETEKLIDKEFTSLRAKDTQIKESIDFLSSEFDKIQEKEMEYLRKNKRFTRNYEDNNSRDSRSERSDAGEKDNLIINKIFLNSIIDTNQVSILQKKQTLEEERNYIAEIFKLNELFPTSISKQLILVDFYTTIYTFCVKERFTIQQISTILSIFYFLFSYCFINSNIVIEKSLSLFNDIISFHSMDRPPFSYEIFNQEEKEKLIYFGKTSFFRNYSLYENIFQYEVSICFFSRDPKKMPKKELTPVNHYPLTAENLKVADDLPEVIKKIIEEKELRGDEVKEQDEKDEGAMMMNERQEKSQEQIEDEKRLENLHNFINSFYNAASLVEQQKLNEENEKMKELAEQESNEVKGFLNTKIGELNKEIEEKITLVTKNVIDPVNDALAEKEKGKAKK